MQSRFCQLQGIYIVSYRDNNEREIVEVEKSHQVNGKYYWESTLLVTGTIVKERWLRLKKDNGEREIVEVEKRDQVNGKMEVNQRMGQLGQLRLQSGHYNKSDSDCGKQYCPSGDGRNGTRHEGD